MTDYTMVLKGLRHCINLDGLEPNDTRIRCHGCPYFTEPTRCGGILMRDAAAAIEALQAQLPKRGKWLNVTDSYSWYGKCSVCGEEFVVDAYYAGGMNYCPNCGAKTEVQE